MIKSFNCKETEKLFQLEKTTKLPPTILKTALRKLEMLEYAADLNDLRVPPANRLEPLEGKRKGQHSIRINDQWRICFVWREGHVHQVEIVDYH
jgi:toxin HigB-1